MQKKFGEKAENINAKIPGFKLLLADYSIDQIQQAFLQYAKTRDDFPAPANIIQIIENPPLPNYDNVVCTCGKHYGKGIHTPEKRAKSCAWHRRTGVNYNGEIRQWLESWEKEHGEVV